MPSSPMRDGRGCRDSRRGQRGRHQAESAAARAGSSCAAGWPGTICPKAPPISRPAMPVPMPAQKPAPPTLRRRIARQAGRKAENPYSAKLTSAQVTIQRNVAMRSGQGECGLKRSDPPRRAAVRQGPAAAGPTGRAPRPPPAPRAIPRIGHRPADGEAQRAPMGTPSMKTAMARERRAGGTGRLFQLGGAAGADGLPGRHPQPRSRQQRVTRGQPAERRQRRPTSHPRRQQLAPATCIGQAAQGQPGHRVQNGERGG